MLSLNLCVEGLAQLTGDFLAFQAREYFKKAADNSDPDGLYNLGVLYLRGLGLKQDVREARRHFMLAVNISKLRHPKALYQLARMHQKGNGVKKDEATVSDLICLNDLLKTNLASFRRNTSNGKLHYRTLGCSCFCAFTKSFTE